MLVTAGRVEGNESSLGYSVRTPGTVLTPVKHETEEVAYTVSGSGELRLDDGAVSFTKGDAIHIPASILARPSRTPETRTLSWSSASRTPEFRRPSVGSDRLTWSPSPKAFASRSPGPAASSPRKATPT